VAEKNKHPNTTRLHITNGQIFAASVTNHIEKQHLKKATNQKISRLSRQNKEKP